MSKEIERRAIEQFLIQLEDENNKPGTTEIAKILERYVDSLFANPHAGLEEITDGLDLMALACERLKEQLARRVKAAGDTTTT